MSKTKVKLRIRGINAVMTSRGVTAQVAREAQRMRQAAGENFEVVINPHRWTARAFIRTANAEGRREQAENAVLERAVTS